MPSHDEPTANDSPNRSLNQSEPTANDTANKPEPFGERKPERDGEHGEPDAQQWRNVQEVADTEGLTERAIQKRCQRGFYVARLVEGDKGEVWEIDESSIKTKGASTANISANATTNKPEPFAEPTASGSPNNDEPIVKQTASNADFIPAADDRSADQHEVELLRVQLESARAEASREREFSALLKSQLEAVTQSEAQTKAALREALRAMPKALPGATDTSPPNAQPPGASGAPQVAQANNVPSDAPDAVRAPATRTPRPLWKVMFGFR